MNNYISTYQKVQPMKNEKLWFPENVNFYFPMENDYICYGVFTFGKNKQTNF